MNDKTITNQQLAALAPRFNTPEFIKCAPVQFPHRYSRREDVEVSGFVTAWISWGNRKQIIKTAEMIDSELFEGNPYGYLQSGKWAQYQGDERCFYRTCKYKDFYSLMNRLDSVYREFGNLENAVVAQMTEGLNPAAALSRLFAGIPGVADATKKSPCKRLWFFLRWMVRRDGIVDLGIWTRISPKDLIIPLDVHVFEMAHAMGITTRRSADIRAAEEITNRFRQVFPDDPALGDFALFGLGVGQ